jgi:hypothetical protein
MTFGLSPPKNVTNLFGNCWLKDIPKKDLIQTRNDYVFNKPKKFFLAGYSYGYSLDLYHYKKCVD